MTHTFFGLEHSAALVVALSKCETPQQRAVVALKWVQEQAEALAAQVDADAYSIKKEALASKDEDCLEDAMRSASERANAHALRQAVQSAVSAAETLAAS
jgi:hypothetical protein